MKLGDRIKDFKELKQVLKNGYCDVRIQLIDGAYSRKTVYEDLGCFNYIDETEDNFSSNKEAKEYWDGYFRNHIVTFDGYN
jgi:hypothetical protein